MSASPLSPPPPEPGWYGSAASSPALARHATFGNELYSPESPDSSAEPSPLRRPLKSIRQAATSTSSKPSAGDVLPHLAALRAASQTGDADVPTKRHVSFTEPEVEVGQWAIGAHHTHHTPLDAHQLLRTHISRASGHPSAVSEASSCIEWSLSSISLGRQASAPHAEASCLSSQGAAPPSAAAGGGPQPSAHPPAGAAAGPAHDQDAEAAFAELVEEEDSFVGEHGHILAPTGPRRSLWSPPSVGQGSASAASSCNAYSLPSGRGMPASGSPRSAGGCEDLEGRSPSKWQLAAGQRWEQHPIFALLHDGREDRDSAAAAAASAGGREAARQQQQQQGHLLPPDAQPGPMPPSPPSPTGLPPLLASASPVLPSSPSFAAATSAHRRYHSAVPLAAPGQWGEALEGSALERAWSVTGSHIDILLRDSRPGPASVAKGQGRGHLGQAELGALWSAPAPPVVSSPAQAPRIGLAPGTYRTAFRRFKRADISHLKRTVKSSPAALKARRSLPLLAGCWAACCLPASDGVLRFRLGAQQLRLLSLGKMPYNADEPLHYSLMQAVSAGFAAAAGGDPREGWREAGFTSANPSATDLIGCGVLGLLQLVLLLEKRPDIAAELRAAAAEEACTQQLQGEGQATAGAAAVSVVLVSVHATLWTLQVLRGGQMTRPARRLSSTSHAAECFYLGAMDCFMALWRESGRPHPLRPLQDVLHRAGQRAKSNVWPMIQRALAVEEERRCPA